MWPVKELFLMKLATAGWVVGLICSVISLYASSIFLTAIVFVEEILDILSNDSKNREWNNSYIHLIAMYLQKFDTVARNKTFFLNWICIHLAANFAFFVGSVSLIVGTKMRSSRALEIWLCINVFMLAFRAFNMMLPIFTYVDEEKVLLGVYKLVVMIILLWILNGTYYLYESFDPPQEI